jgi:WD40 repeat protein
MRLGTRRFQVSTWPVEPVPLTGGAHYLIHHTDAGWSGRTELRWMDAASGVATTAWPVPTGHGAVGASADGRWAVVAKTKHFTTGWRTEPDPKTAPIEFTLYDLSARKPVKSLACQSDELEGPMAQVHRAIVSADGKWVATVNSGDSGTGRVRLWQIATGKSVWASALSDLNGPKYTLVGFTPGSAELVLRAAKDNRIDVVDTDRGVVTRSFPTMAEQVDGQALAPDGSAVILGTYASKARVWDLKTGKERAPLEGHKEWARRFAFTPDGKTLVTGGNDPYLLVRDWPSGVARKRVELGRGAVQSLFVSGDGKYADVLFWWESALARYDLTTGKPVPRPADTHRAPVVAVTVAPDGSVLSVGVDKVLRTWDPATGRQLRSSPLDPGDGTRSQTLTPDGTVSEPCVLSPGGRLRAQPGPDVGKVSVENVKTRLAVATLDARPAGWWAQTTVPAFSPDGRLLAVADGDSVRFWTVNGWREAGSVPATTSALDFSPDGRSLVTADLNDVTVWEVATRRVRATVRAGSQLPTRPQFSPDGRFLAWTVRSEVVEVWDFRRGRMAATFRGHEGRLRDFAFTSDGRSLVTASDDGTLLVWDVAGAARAVPAAVVPSEQHLREAWDDLGSSDPVRAFAGVRVLASVPNRMVPLVRTGVKPAAPVDAAVIERLLVDLASETFATREAATTGLIAAGDAAEGKVRAYLAATPDPEGRLRAGQILAAISGPPATAVRRRELRAVEALEWAGTAGAEELLRGLAKGAPEARLTRDAAAALRRLGPRP